MSVSSRFAAAAAVSALAVVPAVSASAAPASAPAAVAQQTSQVTAQAMRRLSVTVSASPSSVKPMQHLHLRGVVGPRAAGASVYVQVKAGRWQTVPGARTKADRLGRYAIDVWGKRRGTFTLRVVGALGGSSGTSKLIVLKVR